MNQTVRLPSVLPWEHWPADRLLKEKERNPRAFARGFQMRAFSDDERMFPSFGSCFTPGISVADIARRGWPVFVGVDLAGPKRPGTVAFVAALDPSTQRRYPIEINVGNWTSPQTARVLEEVNRRNPQTRIIMVENNGYQQALVDWIRASPFDHSFWHKVDCYTTTASSKHSEIYGLPSLEVEFKNRAWVVPADEFQGHPPACRCGWCVWTAEVRDYPMSAQTDTVMAMHFCREAMVRWGGTGVRGNSLGDINVR